jgi:transcriptional regulator with XRE-family HTH domain
MLGPMGHRVRRNVKATRARRDLTIRDLAARLQELGQPIAPPELSRLESGMRRIHIDELAALAVALGVRLPDLLEDLDADPGQPIQPTPAGQPMESEEYRRWAGIRDRLVMRAATDSAGLSDTVIAEVRRPTAAREPLDDSELGGES